MNVWAAPLFSWMRLGHAMLAGGIARLALFGANLAAASYAGRQGHPVVLGRSHWAAVARQATGDRGARGYLAAHAVTLVPCDDVGDGTDLDVP